MLYSQSPCLCSLSPCIFSAVMSSFSKTCIMRGSLWDAAKYATFLLLLSKISAMVLVYLLAMTKGGVPIWNIIISCSRPWILKQIKVGANNRDAHAITYLDQCRWLLFFHISNDVMQSQKLAWSLFFPQPFMETWRCPFFSCFIDILLLRNKTIDQTSI